MIVRFFEEYLQKVSAASKVARFGPASLIKMSEPAHGFFKATDNWRRKGEY